MARLRLGLYGTAHFLVDFGCALLLLGGICPEWDPATAILLYNFLAFAVQMPIGLLADRYGRCHLFAAAGCLLVVCGWIMPSGLAAVTAAGLGNAAFHVGGGLHTLNESGNRAGPLGMFVSPGAFGVCLGGVLAGAVSGVSAAVPVPAVMSGLAMRGLSAGAPVSGTVSDLAVRGLTAAALLPWAVCVVLILFAVLLWRFGRGTENVPLALPKGKIRLWGAAACLLAVVILRSYLGLAAKLPWKAEFGLLAVCAMAGGKAAGGYLADRLGVLPTALISLCLSALCFLGSSYPAAGLAALFLFNMTMPLTLWAAARLFPEMKGFSFGLLTFGLFLGFLPVYFGVSGLASTALAAGTMFSLPPLILGIREARGEKGEGK